MPVDDRDESSSGASAQTDANAAAPPPSGSTAGGSASAPPPARTGWRRRFITRRNALYVAVVAAVGAFLLLLLVVFMYRTGRVDALISDQIVRTLAQYGIRAEIKEFRTRLGPRTAEIKGLELYDAQTGAHLGRIDTIIATIRVEDLYALKLSRDVNLEALELNGLEAWVQFDEQGRSNFRNLHLPPPEPNKRILFSYSTAQVQINNAVIHYGDQQHSISGEARNLRATVQPDNPAAPAESWMNTVTLSASNSTFVYDGRPVNDISLDARGRINQTRAEVQDLVLRSPLAEARIVGVMDDWRNLTYN